MQKIKGFFSKFNLKSALSLMLAAIICVLSVRFLVVIVPEKNDYIDTKKGAQYINSLEDLDAQDTENQIRIAQERYEAQRKPKKPSSAKMPTNINFKKAYKDIVISGDSIVKAAWEYGILDKSQVMAEISAGTPYLKKITKKIVKANPKYLILHYGENEISTKKHAKEFAYNYKKCIQRLQKKLPNTVIYVDSIFPVKKKAIKNEPYLKLIPYYNKQIKKVAEETGVTYIDFDPFWKSLKKDYYDADGIHPLGSFYSEQYLPYILMEVGYKID